MKSTNRGKPSFRRIAARGALPALLAAILVAILATSLRLEPRLELRDGKGALLSELALPDGRFEHVFIHSFHLTPVKEYFVLEREGLFRARLRLYELRYQDLGTGMPEDAELGYRLEEGWFVLTMDRSFEKIPIMVSIVPGHGVLVGGKLHPFTDWVPAEKPITLEGRFVPVIRFGGSLHG